MPPQSLRQDTRLHLVNSAYREEQGLKEGNIRLRYSQTYSESTTQTYSTSINSISGDEDGLTLNGGLLAGYLAIGNDEQNVILASICLYDINGGVYQGSEVGRAAKLQGGCNLSIPLEDLIEQAVSWRRRMRRSVSTRDMRGRK